MAAEVTQVGDMEGEETVFHGFRTAKKHFEQVQT